MMFVLNSSPSAIAATSGLASMAFHIYLATAGSLRTSWAAIVVKKSPAVPRSDPFLLKKLAARRSRAIRPRATVRAIVDLPVPAFP